MNKAYASEKTDYLMIALGTAALALNLYLFAGEFIRWTN